jgi:hypothetical protein
MQKINLITSRHAKIMGTNEIRCRTHQYRRAGPVLPPWDAWASISALQEEQGSDQEDTSETTHGSCSSQRMRSGKLSMNVEELKTL